jgi:hypothetical protein
MKMPRGIFTPSPSFYRLTAGGGNSGPRGGISELSDGISGGGGQKFNVFAQISGANFWPMYREVHHFVGVHGSRKIAKEIRVSTRWENSIT